MRAVKRKKFPSIIVFFLKFTKSIYDFKNFTMKSGKQLFFYFINEISKYHSQLEHSAETNRPDHYFSDTVSFNTVQLSRPCGFQSYNILTMSSTGFQKVLPWLRMCSQDLDWRLGQKKFIIHHWRKSGDVGKFGLWLSMFRCRIEELTHALSL